MEDQETTNCVMTNFRGRKLTWCGFDEEEEKFYLFFEGMNALVVTDIVVAAEGQDLARRILAEHLGAAKHMIELSNLAESGSDKGKQNGGDGASQEAVAETPRS
jgi:hypothetical protein